MTGEWQKAEAEALASLRAAYLADLNRLALSLRPRFESGELRGYNDRDGDEEDEARRAFFLTHPGPSGDGGDAYAKFVRERPKLPPDILDDACAEFFGLDEAAQERDFGAAFRRASLLRSVSPGDEHTEDAQPNIGQAVIAVSLDVIAIARARGWYEPTPDECPPQEWTRWAKEIA